MSRSFIVFLYCGLGQGSSFFNQTSPKGGKGESQISCEFNTKVGKKDLEAKWPTLSESPQNHMCYQYCIH